MREALKVLSIAVVVVGATKQVLVLRGFEGAGFNINPVGLSEALLSVYTRVDEPEEGEDGEDDGN